MFGTVWSIEHSICYVAYASLTARKKKFQRRLNWRQLLTINHCLQASPKYIVSSAFCTVSGPERVFNKYSLNGWMKWRRNWAKRQICTHSFAAHHTPSSLQWFKTAQWWLLIVHIILSHLFAFPIQFPLCPSPLFLVNFSASAVINLCRETWPSDLVVKNSGIAKQTDLVKSWLCHLCDLRQVTSLSF